MNNEWTDLSAISEYENALDTISKRLNDAIVELLGEDADWENHVGECELPLEYRDGNKWLAPVWTAREEANSAIAWIQGQQEQLSQMLEGGAISHE